MILAYLIKATQKLTGSFARISLLFIFALTLVVMPYRANAQVGYTAVDVQGSQSGGYGRLRLNFPNAPIYDIKSRPGVLIINFKDPVRLDVGKITRFVGGYISAARMDPDGKALRIALAQEARVNSRAAAEFLFLDFLPNDWNAAPPSLPEDVIQELARRAMEAERLARENKELMRLEGRDLRVSMRYAVQPKFTRVQFDWTKPVPTQIDQVGQNIQIVFDRDLPLSVAELNVNKPRYIQEATSRIESQKLIVSLKTDPGVKVRSFQDGLSYVLDLSPSSQAEDITDNNESTQLFSQNQLPPKLENEIANAVELEQSSTELAFAQSDDNALLKPQSELSSQQAVGDNSARFNISGYEGLRLPKRRTELDSQNNNQQNLAALSPVSNNQAQNLYDSEKEVIPAHRKFKGLEVSRQGPVKIVGDKNANGLDLYLPFSDPTPIAAFKRGDILWIVMDTDRSIDTGAITEYVGSDLFGVAVQQSENRQVIQARLNNPYLVTAELDGNVWRVSLSELDYTPPQPLFLNREIRSDFSFLRVDYPQAGNVHWLNDETHGDVIAAVTALTPRSGTLRTESFVELEAMPTGNGLGIIAKADDLIVEKNNQGQIIISRPGGLKLAPLEATDSSLANYLLADPMRPGFVNLRLWENEDKAYFYPREREYQGAIFAASEVDKSNARMQLAQYYLSHGLAHEALGVLDVAFSENPSLSDFSIFRAMRGMAAVEANYIKRSREDLLLPQYDQDADIALWRGFMYAKLNNIGDARLNLIKGGNTISDYPLDMQTKMRLTYADIMLQSGDFDAAARMLNEINLAELSADQLAEYNYYQGELALGLGDISSALENYAKVLDQAEDNSLIWSRADLRAVELGLEAGGIQPKQAIKRLLSNQMNWRGDKHELNVVDMLSSLMIKEKEYRGAFEVTKSALLGNYDDPELRRVQLDMQQAFIDFFVKNRAEDVDPVEALALYYDFRELTPTGRSGDDIVRVLADKLIDLDLLDQAAELLQHQVSHRLRGVARSHVAAKLAMVYLMDGKPAQALRTLDQTELANLPNLVVMQRVFIQARALAETGRTELALEILNRRDENAARKLRAEIYWRDQSWQRAGEQYEFLVGNADLQPRQLTSTERLNILRASISYALAGDLIGLDRLRDRYLQKMSQGPDAASFNLITASNGMDTLEAQALTERLTGIDTLDEFLTEYRARFDRLDVALSDADFIKEIDG